MTMHKPFIITIVGAENSGKTSLAMYLASYFGCVWVPEFARAYLPSLEQPYTLEDLEKIALGQLEWIKAVIGNQNYSSTEYQQAKDEIDSDVQVIKEEYVQQLTSLIMLKIKPYSRVLIIDGGMLNLQMWAKIKYGITLPVIEDAMVYDVTDLYVLCRPWKEWTADPWREAPLIVDRAWIYNQYLSMLSKGKKEFEIVALVR